MAELTITVPSLAVEASVNATDTGNVVVKFSDAHGKVFVMNKPETAAITVADGVVSVDSNLVSFDSKYGSYDLGEASFNSSTNELTIPVTYTGTKASFANASYELQLHIMALDTNNGKTAFVSFAPVITPSANGKILLQFFHDVSRGYTKKSVVRRLIRKASADIDEATVLASAASYSDIFEALGFTSDNFTETLVDLAYDTANPRSIAIAAQVALDGEYNKVKCDALIAGARNAFDVYNNYIDYNASNSDESNDESNNELTDEPTDESNDSPK